MNTDSDNVLTRPDRSNIVDKRLKIRHTWLFVQFSPFNTISKLNHYRCISPLLKHSDEPNTFFYLEAFSVSKLKITQADATIATSFSFYIFHETNLLLKCSSNAVLRRGRACF